MTPPTPADFKAWFPEFLAETDLRIQSFFDRADPMFDVDRWAGWYIEGLFNYVAHGISSANIQAARTLANDDTADAIKKRAGDTEIAFSDKIKLAQLKGSPLLKTEYGQQFLYLQQLVGIGAVAV